MPFSSKLRHMARDISPRRGRAKVGLKSMRRRRTKQLLDRPANRFRARNFFLSTQDCELSHLFLRKIDNRAHGISSHVIIDLVNAMIIYCVAKISGEPE